MMKHTSDMDAKVTKALAKFKDACWEAQSGNGILLGMSAREAYEIFDYLEMIMDEKGIVLGNGITKGTR